MDKFKFEHFKKYHGFDLKSIIRLTEQECEQIRHSLFLKYRVTSDKELFLRIIDRTNNSEVVETITDNTLIERVFSSTGIVPNRHIYLVWGSLDNIDTMPFDDFCKYFDDIWYPSSDDIGVFDDSLSWLILITHYGAILQISDEHDVRR